MVKFGVDLGCKRNGFFAFTVSLFWPAKRKDENMANIPMAELAHAPTPCLSGLKSENHLYMV